MATREYIVGGPLGATFVSETNTRQYMGRTGYVAETTSVVSTIIGTLAVTLDAVTLTSASDLDIKGTFTVTINPITVSTNGDLIIRGTFGQTIAAVTVSTNADLIVKGQLAQTIDPVTLISMATVSTATRQYMVGGDLGATYLSETGSRQYMTPVGFAWDTPEVSPPSVASEGSFNVTLDPVMLSATGNLAVIPPSGQPDGDAGERRKKRRGRIFTIIIEEAKKVVERPLPLRKKRKKLAKLIAEEVLPEAGGLLAADKLLLELMIRRQLEQIPLTEMHTEGWNELQDQLLEVITDAEQTAQRLRFESEEEDDLLLLLTS